ncbi:MAG: DinB family protein [Bacteroidota bacterium]
MEAKKIMVKMVLDRWYSLLKVFDTILDSVSDEQMLKEVSPGKNRGIYLFGHLIAVHDDMLPILNLGEKLFPELEEPFIKFPDKATSVIPSSNDLRKMWRKQNEVLNQKFESLSPDEWFEKHNSISVEEFAKEPHRNKLNVMITRISHLSYHSGQLALLKQVS